MIQNFANISCVAVPLFRRFYKVKQTTFVVSCLLPSIKDSSNKRELLKERKERIFFSRRREAKMKMAELLPLKVYSSTPAGT